MMQSKRFHSAADPSFLPPSLPSFIPSLQVVQTVCGTLDCVFIYIIYALQILHDVTLLRHTYIYIIYTHNFLMVDVSFYINVYMYSYVYIYIQIHM
jgi:hypothetical protein